MRYLVKARLKQGQCSALLRAVENGSLGEGSVAGDEYIFNMEQARITPQGTVHWVETCFCSTPLQEEKPHWEKYFDLIRIKDAHARRECRDLNGTEPWACCHCTCTERLENRLRVTGLPFLQTLRSKTE